MCKLKKDVVFYAITIFILIFAFLPHKSMPSMIDQIDTRYLHVLAFGTLTFYMCCIRKVKLKKTFYMLMSLGIFIEVTQGLFTTREFDLMDIVYDLIGYGLIVFCWFVWGYLENSNSVFRYIKDFASKRFNLHWY